jgi:hypothetical protein
VAYSAMLKAEYKLPSNQNCAQTYRMTSLTASLDNESSFQQLLTTHNDLNLFPQRRLTIYDQQRLLSATPSTLSLLCIASRWCSSRFFFSEIRTRMRSSYKSDTHCRRLRPEGFAMIEWIAALSLAVRRSALRRTRCRLECTEPPK